MGWFKKQDTSALDEAVRAAAKPATQLVVEQAHPGGYEFPPVSTHFGGEPYAEQGDAWPAWGDDRRPMDFVCQIDLNACPDRPDAPFDLITVFLCWRAIEEVDVDGACLVRSYTDPGPSKAVRLSRPEQHGEDDYQVVACSVGTEQVLTYPWSERSDPAVRTAAAEFRDPGAAYEAALKRLGGWDQFFSRVGGYPTWVQDSSLEYDDLVFLAQIAYEPEANNCIQDAGPIYIAFSESDPAKFETDVFQSF